MSAAAELRILRVIARLNVGGPAIQAITLTAELAPRGYRTVLVRGREHPDEGSMDGLAERLGVRPVLSPYLGRELGPRDALALRHLVGLIRGFRPHVIHSHAAKAGTVARTAARIARSPARTVHTFHGHVLEGYFSPAKSRAFTRIERVLARRTDALVAVSDEVRDDLVRLGVAPPGKFTVIPLGFDLSPFAATPAERAAARAEVRAELGLGEAPVVLLVARLVPIKRVDRFLRIARRVAEERPDARFVVVGDGEAGAALRASDDARALGGSVVWAGLRGDVPRFVHAADVVALTSDNEGTPVSLIEAQAAGAPVVATAVGGVRATVLDGVSARLVAPEDEEGFARTTLELLADPAGAAAMGAAGVEHALGGFGLEALVDRVDALYRSLL